MNLIKHIFKKKIPLLINFLQLISTLLYCFDVLNVQQFTNTLFISAAFSLGRDYQKGIQIIKEKELQEREDKVSQTVSLMKGALPEQWKKIKDKEENNHN